MRQKKSEQDGSITNNRKPPEIDIKKIGVVSHDYRYKEKNGYRDFSYAFSDILGCLDDKGCDSVLFSLFTIVSRNSFRVTRHTSRLKNIKCLFLEEFEDRGGNCRRKGRYVIHFESEEGWGEYELLQKFGSLSQMNQTEIDRFIDEVKNRRIFGNCTVLLCGESNIVKYSKLRKKVEDEFGYLGVLPDSMRVFLNPIHDRMTRFEMKRKRQFLSHNNRWVLSVWNKGKEDKNGKVRDGNKPAWTVFHDGEEVTIPREDWNFSSKTSIEVGILDIENA